MSETRWSIFFNLIRPSKGHFTSSNLISLYLIAWLYWWIIQISRWSSTYIRYPLRSPSAHLTCLKSGERGVWQWYTFPYTTVVHTLGVFSYFITYIHGISLCGSYGWKTRCCNLSICLFCYFSVSFRQNKKHLMLDNCTFLRWGSTLCHFEFEPTCCISDSFVDYDGYSISSKEFLPTVVDIMVTWIKFTQAHPCEFDS